jgi:hypothetical protein
MEPQITSCLILRDLSADAEVAWAGLGLESRPQSSCKWNEIGSAGRLWANLLTRKLSFHRKSMHGGEGISSFSFNGLGDQLFRAVTAEKAATSWCVRSLPQCGHFTLVCSTSAM